MSIREKPSTLSLCEGKVAHYTRKTEYIRPLPRNNWHSHHVGQVLLITGGKGWYQEEGKPARLLQSGDIVNIPPNVKHWHCATKEKNGWTRFVSMQNHLNLIYHEEEREMMPLCRDQKIASTPYSPLASGRLIRDWSESTHRSETDQVQKSKYDATADADRLIVERVAPLAEQRGVPRIHIALSWLLQKESVAAPIIGATKVSQLEDAAGALSVKLTPEEVAFLEELYVPHPVVGAQ